MTFNIFSQTTVIAFLLILISAISVLAQEPSSVKSFDTGEVTLNYELTGTGEPLVLIHG